MKFTKGIGLSIAMGLAWFEVAKADPQTGYMVNNAGCKQFFVNGQCKACSERYYMGNDKICQPVNPNCQGYNPNNGDCTSCYSGFVRIESTCLPESIFKQFDFNCNRFEDGHCVKCSQGYYFDQQGKCKLADPSCLTFNEANGKCTSCYPGYSLQTNGKCGMQVTEQGCKSFSGGVCLECSGGYYFNKQRKCTRISDNCKQFNILQQRCLQCYPGYALNKASQCDQKAAEQLSDPNCKQWNHGKCIECSSGSYFNAQGKCMIVDPQCKSYSRSVGTCVECYSGYKLNTKGNCQVDNSVKSSDPNCKTWRDNICSECSFGAYLNEKAVCTLISPSCKKFDQILRRCQQCYPGYQLNQKSQCVQSKKDDEKYKLCKLWDDQRNRCLSCADGSYFNQQNACTKIDPLCQNFNLETKQCVRCYTGYKLERGVCVPKTAADTDPYCKQYGDQYQEICISCADRYFLNRTGRCQQVDKLCQTYNLLNGSCFSCFAGYKLKESHCVLDDTMNNDPNCRIWLGGICTECSNGSYLSKTNKCQLIDPQCQKFDLTQGICLSCYSGYRLENKVCVVDKNFAKQDPNCAQFQNNFCVKCSKGYYFNLLGECTQTDPLCATADLKNGQCLSCFPGYVLKGGKCIVQERRVTDPYCAEFDAKNNCIKCSKGFYFNKNRECQMIDPLCRQFDQKVYGCTSCYEGFVLLNKKCIIDENGVNTSKCSKWVDGLCTKCTDRAYFLPNGNCAEVSKLCKTYNERNGFCTSCFPGYNLNNNSGVCEVTNTISGCAEIVENGKCKRCSQGYYLSGKGDCIQVDDQCANFDYQQLQCTKCYPGYSLVNSKCVLNKVDDTKKIENCAKYDGEGKCIECFDRFYLDLSVNRGKCKEVSFFCKDYDKLSGGCTNCYSGFKRKGYECALE